MTDLSDDNLKQAILEALAGHTVMSLATHTGPHAVSLMYANHEFDLFWFSDPKTNHSRHLESESRCAVTIARQYDDFRKIMGLQMTGQAVELKDANERDEAFTLLTARYTFLQKTDGNELAHHLGKAGVYRFRPERITLIDNSRGFGFKQILQL